MKIQKKKKCGGRFGGGGGGGQGRCERRSEVFVKFKNKILGGGLGSASTGGLEWAGGQGRL